MTLGLRIFTCFNFINTAQFRRRAELRFSKGMCIIIMLQLHADIPISVQQ